MILTIKAGKHTPINIGRAVLRVTPVCKRKLKKKKLCIEGKFLTDPYNTQGDKDLRFDWSKFGGLNINLFAEASINSIMLAFRANPENETWELGLYSNKNRDIIFPTEVVPVKKNEPFRLEIQQIDAYSYVAAIFTSEGLMTETEFIFDMKMKCGNIIGPWHGGDDSDNNGIGGVSPVDIKLEFNYNFS